MGTMKLHLLPVVYSVVVAVVGVEASSSGYRRSRYGCEGTELQLTCEPGTVISPVRANYGRFSIKTCNPTGNSGWSTRCIQPTSLRQVSTLCTGQTACSIDVTSSVFGDPCPGTYKYLEVHYTCVRQEATAANSQQQAASLSADLPPWLLKMTATTSSPRPEAEVTSSTASSSVVFTSESSTAAASEAASSSKMDVSSSSNNMEYQITELLQPHREDRYELVEDLTIVYDNNVDSDEVDEDDRRREVFINLPLALPPLETAAAATAAVNNDQTVLVASITSVIACCVVVLLAAVAYTKIRQNRRSCGGANSTKSSMIFGNGSSSSNSSNSSLYQQYRPQYVLSPATTASTANTNNTASLYEYSSGSSMGSIYTTLPNGQQALIIPINNSNFNSNQFLSHLQFPSYIPASSFLQSTENIYIEIDPQQQKECSKQ